MGAFGAIVNNELALDKHYFDVHITRMTQLDHMLEVERRAFDARKTVAQVCDIAGVYASSWSRAKSRERVSIDVITRMERALDKIEREKAK